MADKSQIRLGGVELVYHERHGLFLYDAHERRIRLQIHEADLPELVDFVCRQIPSLRRTIKPGAPHWQNSATAGEERDKPPVSQ